MYIVTNKGDSKFCFSETLNVSQGKAEGNIQVKGNQNLLFPSGSVIKCFVAPSNSKVEKTAKNCLLYTGLFVNLPRFQGARPDHVRVESSCCCFPRELVTFEPLHVTLFPPIGKYFLVGRDYNGSCTLMVKRRTTQN